MRKVEAAAPAEIRELIDGARRDGGGVRLSTRLTSDAYAWYSDHWLEVGPDWVRDAQRDPREVYSNIAHELGGHKGWGDELSWEIAQEALHGLPGGDELLDDARVHSQLYDHFGYPETECYAELRELPWRTSNTDSDDPNDDVPEQLQALRAAFPPEVAEAIVRRMWARIDGDPAVARDSRDLFVKTVRDTFSIELDPG
jgi:hypothetical protein